MKFRHVEVLTGRGMPHLDVRRQIGATEQTLEKEPDIVTFGALENALNGIGCLVIKT